MIGLEKVTNDIGDDEFNVGNKLKINEFKYTIDDIMEKGSENIGWP